MLKFFRDQEQQRDFEHVFIIMATKGGKFSGENFSLYRRLYPEIDQRGRVPYNCVLSKRCHLTRIYHLAICEEETKPGTDLLANIRHCFSFPTVPKRGKILWHVDLDSITREIFAQILWLMNDLDEENPYLELYFHYDLGIDLNALLKP